MIRIEKTADEKRQAKAEAQRKYRAAIRSIAWSFLRGLRS